ncbi:Transcription elongation regulator 1 [Dissostichus eleginoides]|uniref:Transcription elongation regulator 1 n=1 Tax=Dissostichus eleginoides TaxID=100907 RepID=A0AAD9BKL2_DISEL|nr:Transcription elongation regulator 1 [Dissostichus eleginoides]
MDGSPCNIKAPCLAMPTVPLLSEPPALPASRPSALPSSLLLPKPGTSVQREGTWDVGGVDGRPHGEVLLSLSLSAHLTAAVAGLPKARPQARASCGPPAGPASLPQPIRAPFLGPPPRPAAQCPKMPSLSVPLCAVLK